MRISAEVYPLEVCESIDTCQLDGESGHFDIPASGRAPFDNWGVPPSRSCMSALWTASCRGPASSWTWCICGECYGSEDDMPKFEDSCLCSYTKAFHNSRVSSPSCCEGLGLGRQEQICGGLRSLQELLDTVQGC